MSSSINNKTNDEMFRLRIKSFKDVEISVPSGSMVAHLKQQVRAALEDDGSSDRYLRLICKGRLLLPDDHPIQDFNVQDGDVVHAVLAPAPTQKTAAGGGEASAIAPRRRHQMIIGPGGRVTRAPNLGDDDDEDESIMEEGEQRRGFDRLRLLQNGVSPAPLSRSEVTAIRAYFSRQVDRYMAQNQNPEEPDPMTRRYQAEEDWMAGQGPASEFRMNLNQNMLMASVQQQMAASRVTSIAVGTDRDFVWGFMLGFFLEFVMLVWVWMPTVPHKQKIGILTGISFKLSLGVFAPPNTDEDDYEMGD